ncbi:MAG: hypothetical protein O8C67_09460 [Candidatus Methanoperedens sp.]|nr:hypothetical protein [Candidatus Methanoperedens sp.]
MIKKSLEERFWEKVDIKGNDECWNWLAHSNKGGYGQIGLLYKVVPAHRISWEYLE